MAQYGCYQARSSVVSSILQAPFGPVDRSCDVVGGLSRLEGESGVQSAPGVSDRWGRMVLRIRLGRSSAGLLVIIWLGLHCLGCLLLLLHWLRVQLGG